MTGQDVGTGTETKALGPFVLAMRSPTGLGSPDGWRAHANRAAFSAGQPSAATGRQPGVHSARGKDRAREAAIHPVHTSACTRISSAGST